MPNLSDVSPDEAMQLGRCPECGRQLMQSMALVHAEDHWPSGRRRSREAQRRYDMLVDFAKGQFALGTETSSHDTRDFWIDQIIAAAIFAVGLEMLRGGISVLGILVTGAGFVWLIFLRYEHKPITPRVRTPNLVAVGALFLATLVVGYDIYDRHHTETPASGSSLAEKWQTMKLQNIYHQTYRDETVEVDGKRFVSCVFDNVTFVFRGTAPFEFNPWPLKVTGHFIIRATPDAPIVAKTLDLCTASEFNAGCRETTINQSPIR